jgi:hypothetical protein
MLFSFSAEMFIYPDHRSLLEDVGLGALGHNSMWADPESRDSTANSWALKNGYAQTCVRPFNLQL